MKRALFLFCIALGSLQANANPAEGQRVFVCGHSFHVFIDRPLAALALEAGHTGHTNAGKLFLGGSTPLQIWGLPDTSNSAKSSLKTGAVDVLTLSPREVVPDRGIDLYSDLAAQFNPAVRVFLQVSWSPQMVAKPDPVFWRKCSVDYMALLREQAGSINKRHNRDYVHLVPVGPALITLWERINSGKVPGVSDFHVLFSDETLHPTPILKNLVSYCWFAAIYGESPVGLKALDVNVPAATNRILQQIAWEAVNAEPMSGLH